MTESKTGINTAEKGSRQRNCSIDAVKGLAILLVMLGHVFVHNHMEDPYLYDAIRAVQMPLFMLVSGYLCGSGRKVTDAGSYVRLMKKRAAAYLVPFFAWLTIKHLTDLGAAYRRIFFELDFGLWFLAVLFLLTFFVSTAQLAASFLRSKNHILSEIVFWGVCGGFCAVLLIQCIIGNSFLSPSLTLLYVPFYLLGYVTGDYGKKFLCWGSREEGKLDCKYSRIVQAAAVLCAAAFLFLVVKGDLNSMATKLEILVQMTASVFGSLAIIYGILQWREGRVKTFLAKLGQYTLEIYVIHYHFANLLNRADRQYRFYTPEGAVFVAASFAVMSVLTFGCIWLMKKSRAIDFLFFGKTR